MNEYKQFLAQFEDHALDQNQYVDMIEHRKQEQLIQVCIELLLDDKILCTLRYKILIL